LLNNTEKDILTTLAEKLNLIEDNRLEQIEEQVKKKRVSRKTQDLEEGTRKHKN